MIKLTGSVGRMGLNRKHDVALVQKIMSLVKVRTKFGLKPIWSKRIDGRYTREMEPALMCLQEHIGQKPTGKLECTAQTMNALTRAVPAHERGLLALEGTSAVASPGTANRPAERIARETEAKAPFPMRERKALAQALIRVGKESGFFLKRQQDYVTADGRFASQLAFDITTAPEPGSGREVERALTKIVEAAPGWSAIAGGRLAFRTKLQVNALKGLGSGPLSADDKKLLGVTSPPKTAALVACAKGCAQLIRSGRAAKPDGKKEAAIIIEAAANADPQLGKLLAQAASGQTIKPSPTSWPVATPIVTSGFGPRQIRLPGASKFHDAIDFEATLGAAIFSTEDGEVFSIGYNARAGNHFFISNHDGSMSSYSHTSPLPGLAVGQKVKAGQQIGTSDGTGNITKPHLHYTYRPGTLANPATPGSAKVNPLTTQFAGMSYAVVP